MAGTATATGTALEDLRGQIRGEVISGGDPGYAEACRIWNGMIEREPVLVVRCSGAADVIAAVRFAREAGLPVSVRSGGHNVAGTALCDGVVVDLTGMRNVFVDLGGRPSAPPAARGSAPSTRRPRRSPSQRRSELCRRRDSSG